MELLLALFEKVRIFDQTQEKEKFLQLQVAC